MCHTVFDTNCLFPSVVKQSRSGGVWPYLSEDNSVNMHDANTQTLKTISVPAVAWKTPHPSSRSHLSWEPRHTLSPLNSQRQNHTLPLLAIWLRTLSKTSLCRMALGRERKTPAISLSHNDRLIIVFVCHKSLYNRQHVRVLFSAS